MSKKYRQPGYKDEEKNNSQIRRSPGRSFREGPRSPRMTKYQKTFRCAMCGKTLPATATEIDFASECPGCSADLHTCKHCVYFDPASRFECTQPILDRVSKKSERNQCQDFEVRTTVEKATSSVRETQSSTTSSSVNPREAFERLFKK